MLSPPAHVAPPLDERLVFEWLRHRGLVHPTDVVAGAVSVTPRHSRNANFAVVAGDRAWFVKQGERVGPVHGPSVDVEAAVLELIASSPAFAALVPAVPRRAGPAATGGVLITELLGGETLRSALRAEAMKTPPTSAGERRVGAGVASDLVSVGDALGRVLGALHEVPLEAVRTLEEGGRIHHAVPWFLTIAEREDAHPDSLGGRLRALVIEHGFAEPFAAAVGDWRRDAFTHGDVKGENVVLTANGPVLTDWETADVGDGDWDVAGLLHACLALWVVSMPGGGGLDGAALAARADVDPDAMKPMLRAFWGAYATARGVVPDDRARLERVARLVAARLVQGAAEHSDGVPSAPALRLLQIARHLVDEPLAVLDELLGLGA